MSIDNRELTKLSPQDRIKKLKFMEEERKKEVAEIEELIKRSMQEIRTEKTAEEFAPAARVVDISRLFESEGGRLERSAKKEIDPAGFPRGYQAIAATYQAYSELKEFDVALSMGSRLSKEQMAAIGQIGEKLTAAERYMTEGEKSASKLDASRTVLYKLRKETGL